MTGKKVEAIARKEFYHIFRDVRSLYLAFLLPILLILLFGYALSLDVEDIKVVVVDHDQSELSRLFIDRLDASFYFQVKRYLSNTQEVIQYLEHGWTTIGIIIPPDWTKEIKAGREAQLQVLADGTDPNTANLARGYITGFISQFNKKLLFNFLNQQGIEVIKPPIESQIRVWFNEDLQSRNFIVPGIIAIIIMIVGAILTSLVIAREYENGTMETLLTLPLKAEEFLLGKAIPYFFIALIDVLVAVLMGQMLFGVVMKSNFWSMILASCLYLLVALSLGLFISTATKSQLVANQLAVLTTYLPSLLLSNFVFPISNMPKILQAVSYIVPATYFINILNGIYLEGVGLKYLWKNYLVILGMEIILIGLNIKRLKQEGM
ncbi:MAG: ABC transporter permease [Desulfobacterota bacterium]|nr:ABC transporter permease [Thermodesulfobacteriota bacterium]